jgi:hypothetical protein
MELELHVGIDTKSRDFAKRGCDLKLKNEIKKMNKIKILLYGDLCILDYENNLLIKVKRVFKWNSKIILDFYKKDKLILKTSHYSLLPFKVEKIEYQNLTKKINFQKLLGKETLVVDNTRIKINHKLSYLINKDLCDVLIDDKVIANVKIESRLSSESIILDVFFKEKIEEQVRELCLINLTIKYSDIDGD